MEFLNLNRRFVELLNSQVKRKKIQLVLLTFLLSQTIFAQQQTVTGIIKNSDGQPLAGVTILEKKTTQGTISDTYGKYSISTGRDAVLVFSFIGYLSQEVTVGNSAVIDIILQLDIQQPGEVIITALGVSRTTEALQTSISKVPGVRLSEMHENNLGTSLQGRVAGINITKSNTGPAGSSRVIIRGNKSTIGLNQPLYVVDGIPMDNRNFGQVGVWGGYDEGDGLTSINPADIESVTVMKGAASAALYGSRGGYGVINIVTKKGTVRKGIGVEFSSEYTLEKVRNLSDLQTVYGPGGLTYENPDDPASALVYSKAETQTEAFGWGATNMWGPKLDGTPVIQFDGVMRPYSYAGDNWARFYQTGQTWTNNIAIYGGSEKQTVRFSFSDLRSTYIIPNSGFYRKNLSISTDGKFGEHISFNAKLMYSNEITKNRTRLSDAPGNPVQSVWNLANTVNVEDLKGDPEKLGAVAPGVTTPDLKKTGEEFSQADNPWLQNPWWCAYQMQSNSIRDRIIASATLRYNIFKWLYLQGKAGFDTFTRNYNQLWPQGTGCAMEGEITEATDIINEINLEWIMGIDKEFGKVRINSFVGGNKMTALNDAIGLRGSSFNVPFFQSIINTKFQSPGVDGTKSGINSLFGSAEISYNRYLYLTATARNDWFSVLNPEYNSALYPSIGASFIFTDAFSFMKGILEFGKIRAAWGQVATANTDPYFINTAYTNLGMGHLGRAMGTYNDDWNIPNPSLQPALSTEMEFGTDLRFFSGKLGLDISYYNQKTTGDMAWVTASAFSGYVGSQINIGELSNKGIEFVLNASPLAGPIKWDFSLNLAKNINKIYSLGNGMTELGLGAPRTLTVQIKHIVGYPFGMITGFVQKTNAEGKKVYTSQGQPVRSDEMEILGYGVADLTGGFNNAVTYKGFSLYSLIDFKFGGDIYSGTNVRLTQWGQHKQTLADREGGMIIEGVTNIEEDPEKEPIYQPLSMSLNQQQTLDYWYNLGEVDQAHFIYDASFIKLRQLVLEYTLSSRLLNKTPFHALAVSFTGSNLAILYKKTENIDPESDYSNTESQGLDYFGMPGTRSYGFKIVVGF